MLFRSKKAGGTTKGIYWTLGRYDGLIVFEAPDEASATAIMLSGGTLGSVRTETLRAFDTRLIATLQGRDQQKTGLEMIAAAQKRLELVALIEQFRDAKLSAQAIDYADMVRLALRLVREREDVVARLRSDYKVILLEADRIGSGGSGTASGLLSGESSDDFREVEARHGKRMARAMFAATQLAPRELAATVSRLGIKARLDVGDELRVLLPGRSDKLLRRELTARKDAGLIATWMPSTAVSKLAALDTAGAVRLPEGGFVDPFQLTLGFLRAAIKRGAKVFERSRVKKITFTRKTATAFLDGGAITTTNLAICIGEPTPLFKPLKRHLRHEERYAVLTEIGRAHV